MFVYNKFDIILYTKLRYDTNPQKLIAEAIYRAARHIECRAHIENPAGIYIAAECPLEHSANADIFYLYLAATTAAVVVVTATTN